MAAAGSNRHGPKGAAKPAKTRGGASSNGGKKRSAGSGAPVKMVIPSDYHAGRDVQAAILKQVQAHHYFPHSEYAIRLALEEGLINAIKHGNRLDPAKKVRIAAHISVDQVEISVEDEGPGFDRSSVPDPTLVENLEKCSGRGILLIEAYMTRVSWDRGGRRLRMVRINQPETPAKEH